MRLSADARAELRALNAECARLEAAFPADDDERAEWLLAQVAAADAEAAAERGAEVLRAGEPLPVCDESEYPW